MPTPGKVAVACCVLVGGVVLLSGASLVRAVIGPRPPVPSPVKPEQEAVRAEQFAQYVAQFDGRSLFHVPPAPGAATAAPKPADANTPPPAPTSYGGPSMIAMINDEVWFSDGTRMGVGQAPKDGLGVKSLNAPWDAVLLWKGVEFKVTLFNKNDVVFKDHKGSTPEPEPTKPEATKPETAKPEATKADAAKGEPAKQDPKPDAKPEAKPDTKPETQPETKPSPEKDGPKPAGPTTRG